MKISILILLISTISLAAPRQTSCDRKKHAIGEKALLHTTGQVSKITRKIASQQDEDEIKVLTYHLKLTSINILKKLAKIVKKTASPYCFSLHPRHDSLAPRLKELKMERDELTRTLKRLQELTQDNRYKKERIVANLYWDIFTNQFKALVSQNLNHLLNKESWYVRIGISMTLEHSEEKFITVLRNYEKNIKQRFKEHFPNDPNLWEKTFWTTNYLTNGFGYFRTGRQQNSVKLEDMDKNKLKKYGDMAMKNGDISTASTVASYALDFDYEDNRYPELFNWLIQGYVTKRSIAIDRVEGEKGDKIRPVLTIFGSKNIPDFNFYVENNFLKEITYPLIEAKQVSFKSCQRK